MSRKKDELRVAIVSGNINTINGINTVSRLLINSTPIFSKYGVNLIGVYANDQFITYNANKSNPNTKNPTKRINDQSISYQFKNRLKSSAFVNNYFVQRHRAISSLIGQPSKAIERYFNSSEKADCILLQGIFALIAFYKYVKKTDIRYEEKIILISHATEDPFEQMLYSRPILTNSRFEKDIRKELDDAISLVNRTIVLCSKAKNYFKNKYGIDSTIIFNGIPDIYKQNIYKLTSFDNSLVLGTLGSVTEVKGTDLVLDAIYQLRNRDEKQIILQIAGDGKLYGIIKEKIIEYELEDNVLMMGNISNIDEYLSGLDALIQPSRMDTQPLSVIEAMRSGLPIIATKVGGLTDLVTDGCNGLLVDANIEGIMEGIEVFASLSQLRRINMSQASRVKFCECFTIEKTVENYSNEIFRCYS